MRIRSIAACLLVVVFVAACGNSAATPSATATAAPAPPTGAPVTVAPATPTAKPATGSLSDVVAAAGATIAKGTAVIAQTIEFNGNSSVPDGTKASLTGATAFTKPTQLAATADFSALGVGEFDMIVDNELVYIRGKLVEPLAGVGKWLLVDITSADPRAAGFADISSGQNDASLLLYLLYGGTEPVAALPDQAIDGQQMKHLSLAVDIEAAVTKAPAEARTALEANVASLKTGGMATTVAAEVWIGADGLVHRVDYTYTVGANGGGGTLLVSCAFSDFGEPLDLGIPADTDIVKLEDV